MYERPTNTSRIKRKPHKVDFVMRFGLGVNLRARNPMRQREALLRSVEYVRSCYENCSFPRRVEKGGTLTISWTATPGR